MCHLASQDIKQIAIDDVCYASRIERWSHPHQRIISWTMPDTTNEEAAPSLRRPMLGIAFPLDVFVRRLSVMGS
jgi:hypothetical protein